MILKEFFEKYANDAELMDEVAEAYLQRRNYDYKPLPPKENVIAGMTGFLSKLVGREAKPSEYILMPIWFAIDDGREVRAELFKKADVLAFQPSIPLEVMEENFAKVSGMSSDEIEKLLTHDVPTAYGYLFDEWDDTLGYEVFLPEEADRELEVAFAEDIIWELTFFGIDEEKHRAALQEAIDDIREGEEDVKAGRCKSYTSFDDFRAEMGLPPMPKKTPEEIEAGRKKTYAEFLENEISRTRTLMKCREAIS